jgi:hypothetical protein
MGLSMKPIMLSRVDLPAEAAGDDIAFSMKNKRLLPRGLRLYPGGRFFYIRTSMMDMVFLKPCSFGFCSGPYASALLCPCGFEPVWGLRSDIKIAMN